MPPAAPAPPADDDDLKHLNPKFPKAAAGLTLLAGALGILTAIQALTTVRIRSSLWAAVPYVLLALGVPLVVLARSVFIARPWAAVSAMIVCVLLALASGGWLIFAVSNGFIALYAIWTPAWSFLAAGFCGAALAPSLRAQRAREKLRAEGMEIGI